MFQYAAGSEAALRTVRGLLSSLFSSDLTFLTTESGSRLFRHLAAAEPQAALAVIQRSIGHLSKDDLFELRGARRTIVSCLDDIAEWGDLFPDASRLLLALAEAENEHYSNNATGVFLGLFSIKIYRELSQTEASLDERLLILQEFMQSSSKERKELALKACDRALTIYQGGSFAPHVRIVGKEPQRWVPQTWGDVWDAYRKIWDFLFERLEDAEPEERKEIINILVKNAQSVSEMRGVQERVFECIAILAKASDVDPRRIIEVALQVLNYRGNRLPKKLAKKWRALADKLVGDTFHSLLRRYVGMNLLEDKVNEERKPIDGIGPHVEQLAQMAVANPHELEAELAWLTSYDAPYSGRFGYELARVDTNRELLPLIIATQANADTNSSAVLLAGYLNCLGETEPRDWELLILEFAKDMSLRKWVPELAWRARQITDPIGQEVLEVIKSGEASPAHLQNFRWGGAVRHLSEPLSQQWIEFLLSYNNAEAGLLALELYSHYYLNEASTHQLPETLTLNLLMNPSLINDPDTVQNDQMGDYHWREIATHFLHQYPTHAPLIAELHLQYLGSPGLFSGYYPQSMALLNLITRMDPNGMWRLVASHLSEPDNSDSAYWITEWLRGNPDFDDEQTEGALILFPADLVWAWVSENADERARYLASFVPKKFRSQEEGSCWARELLIRYGEREEVRRKLRSNFWSGGWTGPASLHYQHKKDELLKFRRRERDHNVRHWIDEFVSELEQDIEDARLREERRGF
jgi:hypothetical protein